MSGTEISFVKKAFEGNWISQYGPDVDALEATFSSLTGLACVALNSGTSGIHLGLRALGVGPGDEVVVPSMTFVASCFPVLYLGARPVFIDVDEATWNLDVERLEGWLSLRAASNRLPKVVIVVHLYGQVAPVNEIVGICREYGVQVLEDAAQAIGGKLGKSPVGTVGDVGVYSLNGNKTITGSSGGVLLSRNDPIIEKVRLWSSQAHEFGGQYSHAEIGYNYRMSNVLAAIARGQLEVLEERVAQRRNVARRYHEAFAGWKDLRLMPSGPVGEHTCWLSCCLMSARAGAEGGRGKLMRSLASDGVETRPVFQPLHRQPVFQEQDFERVGGKVAEAIGELGLCLPSSSSLSGRDQDFVISRLFSFLNEKNI